MPGTVGYVGEDKHDKLVRDMDELRDHYLKQWRPQFQTMANDHRLYLGHREDKRKAHEKWRSFSWLGDPARLTDTEVSSWGEILGHSDPPIEVEGRGTEDEWMARGFERYADYILQNNSWVRTQEMILRDLSYYGYKPIKTGWKERIFAPIRRPSKEERIAWDTQYNDMIKSGRISNMPEPDSETFPEWLEQARVLDPTFPAPPQPEPRETVHYRGPWLYRPSPFEIYCDPWIEDWKDQGIIMQRILKPRSWGEEQVKSGKFDEKQFAAAAGSTADDKKVSEWDREIAEEIGLVWDDGNPIYRDSDEYFEIWRAQDEEAPYLVLMNRSAFVNNSTENPFWHRRHPFICPKNTPQERRAFGLGSYHQMRRNFSDRVMFRDLLLDGLLLSVMPVFLKSRNLGMPEMQRYLSPGAILEVNDPNGLKRGWESMAGFAELMQVGQMLLNDQNTQLATWENVQGQQATVGRVSATESQSRLQQALVRHKKKAERIEEELSEMWPLLFYNAYQKYPESDAELVELRRQIVGEDEQDPLGSPMFNRDTFAETLGTTVRFRGATQKINSELEAQQLKDFLGMMSQITSGTQIPVPIMSPEEIRNLARRAYQVMADRGTPDVFTDSGDAAVQQALEAHMVQAQTAPLAAQAEAMQVASMLQPQPIPAEVGPGNGEPPPEEVPPEQLPPAEGEVIQ